MEIVVVVDRRAAVDEDARVRALEDLGVLDTGSEERFDRITRLAQRIFAVPMATVTLIDKDRLYYKSLQGLDLVESPRSVGFCDHTIREPGTLVVEDLPTDPRFATNPMVMGKPYFRFYAGHPLLAPGGYRVGALGLLDRRARTFTDVQRLLLADLAEWVQNELTHSVEMEHAAAIQGSLMPRRSPEIDGYEIAGVCLPSRGVGGDFFDWYRTSDGGMAVTVGDVMGKGMGAAIIMATVRAAMRSAGRSFAPAEAVRQAAATLEEDLERTGTLVTLCHAVVSPGGFMRSADAGHGLMLLVGRDGSIQRPPPGGLPLGVLPGQKWPEDSLQLEIGDIAVAFSDGLLDLYDGTMSALSEIGAVIRSSADSQEIVNSFAALARGRLLEDDVTVVAIQRTG